MEPLIDVRETREGERDQGAEVEAGAGGLLAHIEAGADLEATLPGATDTDKYISSLQAQF